MPREPPVMSAALPAREIIKPPRNRKPKVESRHTFPRQSFLQGEEKFLQKRPESSSACLGRPSARTLLRASSERRGNCAPRKRIRGTSARKTHHQTCVRDAIGRPR